MLIRRPLVVNEHGHQVLTFMASGTPTSRWISIPYRDHHVVRPPTVSRIDKYYQVDPQQKHKPKGDQHMHRNNGTIDSTDIATRMRNVTARCAKESFEKRKKTMTNIDTNEQIDADLARSWFLVLELDAKRIQVGDVLLHHYFHYEVISTNGDVNDGFVSFRFKRTGPMVPAGRRRNLEPVPA
jgi:hypothetical protein